MLGGWKYAQIKNIKNQFKSEKIVGGGCRFPTGGRGLYPSKISLNLTLKLFKINNLEYYSRTNLQLREM